MGLKTATPKEDKDEKRIGKLIKRNPKIKRCLRGLYIKHIEITGQANILEAKTSTQTVEVPYSCASGQKYRAIY